MIRSVVLRKSKWILDIVFTCTSFPSGTDETVSQPNSFIQEYLYSVFCSNFWGGGNILHIRRNSFPLTSSLPGLTFHSL